MSAAEEPARSPRRTSAGACAANTLVLFLDGAIDRAELPLLCENARTLLEAHEGAEIVCELGGLTDPDAVAVDALARLQLAAGRLGRRIRLRNAGARLQELIALMGLKEALPVLDATEDDELGTR